MERILITGATGNTGIEVIRFLYQISTKYTIVAGVRNIEKARQAFSNFPKLEFVEFDFENSETFNQALNNIESVFLLRPPQLSDIEKYFKPLLSKIKEKNVNKVLFLSVQGAEKSKAIPHNKIEKLIKEYSIDYIFLRPAYFMQNLTTTLLKDIQTKRRIILPAGKAKFNWIDVENIGEAAAMLLNDFQAYKNSAIEITGLENMNFFQVSDLIKRTIDERIEYENANPFRFYLIKKNDNMPNGMIAVLILLHFLPRFQKEPVISEFYKKLTGKEPTMLKDFILREQYCFKANNQPYLNSAKRD
jgi:uncharacterized protein YbjT (DUF2867 family)